MITARSEVVHMGGSRANRGSGVTASSGRMVGNLDKAQMRLVWKAVSVKLWKSTA